MTRRRGDFDHDGPFVLGPLDGEAAGLPPILWRRRPAVPQAALSLVALAATLRPPPARLIIPVPQAAPIVQTIPQPPLLAQAGGVLDQSAWLQTALDLIGIETATVERIGTS